MTALVFLLIASLFGGQQAPREAPLELKLRLLEEINRGRIEAGVSPVEYSPELSKAADQHCQEMLQEGYVSHWDRAGRKPYLRYAEAGARGNTAENITSLRDSEFPDDLKILWVSMFSGHQRFMAEVPPDDGHRRSILDPRQTHAGIGVAYDGSGMRLIEVYEARYSHLDAMPGRVTLRDTLTVSGRLLRRNLELVALTVFYEPLPKAMSVAELSQTRSYSLPAEQRHQRVQIIGARYVDGSRGSVEIGLDGAFRAPLNFWKGSPGVYSVGVWVSETGREPFLGGLLPVIVEEGKR